MRIPLQRLGKESRFRSPEHFSVLVDAYIHDCREWDTPPGLVGMILYLGLPSRRSMESYVKANPEYDDAYARARSLCEMHLEQIMATPQPNTGGVQHLLKTLHDHKETQVVEHAPLTVVIEGKDADV